MKATTRLVRPPPPATLSQWAEAHYQLSKESSNNPGRWRAFPYQIEMMDAITDPRVERVTVMKSSRVGYTKACVNASIGYYIHHDPCSIMVVQPTIEDGRKYSRSELTPMLRDCAVLSELVAEPRSRDASNTILFKSYPGGSLRIVGTNAATGFRGDTVRVVIGDEVDGWAQSAGTEGDPITLSMRRAGDAWNPKFIFGSSPGLKSTSRIEPMFEASDQRHYHVPCPHCDHGQVLRWGGRDEDFGIKWPKGDPESAYYLCESCHERIQHHQKRAMVERGQWIAHRPEVRDHAGFWIWAGYSLLPKAAWGLLAKEWLEKKDSPTERVAFVNTVRGETWEEVGRRPDETALMQRRERYPHVCTGRALPDGSAEEVAVAPAGVTILLAGVDVQDDRLEVGVDGFGRGEEWWKLEHHVLWGDPSTSAVWDAAWELICQPRRMERGGVDYIRGVSVDTLGHHTQAAYAFCRPRAMLPTPDGGRVYVFPIRGSGGPGSIWPKAPSYRNIGKLPVYTIRVDPAKEVIYTRLQRVLEPGPGYIHLPDSFERRHLEQLTAEEQVSRADRKGFVHQVWQLKSEGARNEVLDCTVYAYATLCGLRSVGFDLDAEAERIAERIRVGAYAHAPAVPASVSPAATITPRAPASRPPPIEPAPQRTRTRREGWLRRRTGWLR